MSIEFEYQKALFTRLNASKTALGVVGVYDTAPQVANGGDNAAFPYIVMGDITALQLDTQTRNGFTMTSRIHVYSRTGSKAQCKQIQGLIYGLLHRQPLTVTGFNDFELLRNDSKCFTLADGNTHGVCEYIGLVEANA
jgi:hypothetical protein